MGIKNKLVKYLRKKIIRFAQISSLPEFNLVEVNKEQDNVIDGKEYMVNLEDD